MNVYRVIITLQNFFLRFENGRTTSRTVDRLVQALISISMMFNNGATCVNTSLQK